MSALRKMAGGWAAMLLASATIVQADDVATVRTPSGGGKVVLMGRVVDWTGGLLRFRSGDDVHEITGDRVVDVQTSRLPAHLEGLAALKAGKADEAAARLTSALGDEPRVWMRREILAELVRVELMRGRKAAAIRHFLAIEASDSTTRFRTLLPLDWGIDPPDAALASEARGWLQSTDSKHAKLLGASYLLFDPTSGDEAAKMLGELASNVEPRIFTLARAQLWRKQLARGAVSEGEISRWEDRLKEIPDPYRGGPWSLIGRAWSAAGDPERAAAALLWLPLVYDSDPGLAAASAVLAGDELVRIGRDADAIVLFRETVERFPATSAAAEAQLRLDRLIEASRAEAAEPTAR